MERRKSKQANFRLSDGEIDLLEETARIGKMSKTEVIAAGIHLVARQIPALQTQSRKVMQEVVKQTTAEVAKRLGIAPFKKAGTQTSSQLSALAA